MRLLQIGLLGAILVGFGMQSAQAQPVGVVRLTDPDTFIQGAARVPGLYDETYMTIRQDIGDGRGYKRGYTSLGGFATLYKISENQIIFNNSRLIFANEENIMASNVGFGWRGIFDGTIIGASFWFDTDRSNSHQHSRINQTGVSVELLRETWGITGNFYNPTSHGDHPLGMSAASPPFFRGNQIIFLNNIFAEQPMTSADLEIGTVVPGFPALRVFAGPYWYSDEKRESKWGGKFRLDAHVSDAATAHFWISNDPIYKTTTGVAFSYSIGRKWQPLRPFHTQTLDQQLFKEVARTHRVAFRRYSRVQESPAINPRTGNPYFVIHVDPNGAAGTGTFESPYNNGTFVNSAGADIIRVLPGVFNVTGTLQLADHQRLLAANHAHTFISTQGTYFLPSQVAGANPVINSFMGLDVIQLANNNEVSGFDINGGLTGIGIVGNGISDFNLNRLNITNGVDGIRLTNFSQTNQPPPFGSQNIIRDVNVSNSLFTGVRLVQNNGGAGEVNIERLNSTGNGEDGVLMDVTGGGSFTANISGSNLFGNTRNAMRFVLSGGSIGRLNMTDVLARQSGQHGVFVNVTGATLASANFTRVDASNSGQAAMVGLGDGFNFDVTNSTANVSIVDSMASNTGGFMTEENGLRMIVDSGSNMTTTVSGSMFNGNTVAAIHSFVRDLNTVSTLTVSNTQGNNGAADGFLFDVNNGTFTANVSGSQFNGNGRNAIRGIGGASPANINVTFASTAANNSGAEGVFFNILGGGGPSTFNFTYMPTSPSAIINSGGASGVNATFDGAGTVGTVSFNGIQIDGGIISANNNGATVIVSP